MEGSYTADAGFANHADSTTGRASRAGDPGCATRHTQDKWRGPMIHERYDGEVGFSLRPPSSISDGAIPHHRRSANCHVPIWPIAAIPTPSDTAKLIGTFVPVVLSIPPK